jgi:hypothetical protein
MDLALQNLLIELWLFEADYMDLLTKSKQREVIHKNSKIQIVCSITQQILSISDFEIELNLLKQYISILQQEGIKNSGIVMHVIYYFLNSFSFFFLILISYHCVMHVIYY